MERQPVHTQERQDRFTDPGPFRISGRREKNTGTWIAERGIPEIPGIPFVHSSGTILRSISFTKFRLLIGCQVPVQFPRVNREPECISLHLSNAA